MDKPIARPSIREGNERAILAAAEAVFAERGFGGATMAAIAARAGVPKPNVHYYFSDQGDALPRRRRAGAHRLAGRRACPSIPAPIPPRR